MENKLTENQKLLARYLSAVGCESAMALYMIMELWEEEETIKMLNYCADNLDASPAELLKACYKISSQNEAMHMGKNGQVAQKRHPDAICRGLHGLTAAKEG